MWCLFFHHVTSHCWYIFIQITIFKKLNLQLKSSSSQCTYAVEIALFSSAWQGFLTDSYLHNHTNGPALQNLSFSFRLKQGALIAQSSLKYAQLHLSYPRPTGWNTSILVRSPLHVVSHFALPWFSTKCKRINQTLALDRLFQQLLLVVRHSHWIFNYRAAR